MSTPPLRRNAGAGRPKPWRLLATFMLLTIGLYTLAFFVSSSGFSPKLGIDLQGGTRVTLIPKGEPSESDLDKAKEIIRERVNGLGVAGTEVVVDGQNLVLTVPGEDSSAARDLGSTSKLTIRPVVQSVPRNPEQKPRQAPSMGDRGAIERAVAKAKETRQSDNPADLIAELNSYVCPDRDVLAGLEDPKEYLITCGDNAVYLLEPVPALTGEDDDSDRRLDGQHIDKGSVSSGYSQSQGQVEVSFRFSNDGDTNGSQTWANLTQKYLNKQVAIVLDGDVKSAPVIQGVTPVGGNTAITGDFTIEEAATLAENLRYGALPITFEDPNVDNVPASLGLASLRAGLIAGAIGLALVFLYCFLYYRLLGFLTGFSLIVSGLLVYAVLVLLGSGIDYTLDLAGIAGLIIGIGMTADSFVVFFERIKDEIRDGHRFRSAVPRAWKSARRTIWTGNAVSLIAAVVLYVLAAGEVKGFAFTLGLTTITDILVVFTVTWPILYLASTKDLFATHKANGLGGVRDAALQSSAADATPAPAVDATTTTATTAATGEEARS